MLMMRSRFSGAGACARAAFTIRVIDKGNNVHIRITVYSTLKLLNGMYSSSLAFLI